MKFKVNSRLESGVNNKENGVNVVINGPKGKEDLKADVVLLSIGRKPFTGGLALEKAGRGNPGSATTPKNDQGGGEAGENANPAKATGNAFNFQAAIDEADKVEHESSDPKVAAMAAMFKQWMSAASKG